MVTFRNKCKRNDDEFRKMIGSDVYETNIKIEILDDNDTKENSVVNADDAELSSFETEYICVGKTFTVLGTIWILLIMETSQ